MGDTTAYRSARGRLIACLLSYARLAAGDGSVAFHGLHTGDGYLRGTALEYLETVLPEPVWAKLWLFLDEGEAQTARPGRSSEQAMRDLLASQNSIVLALAKVRRQQER